MSEHTHVPPQWQPPTGLRDPFVRRLHLDRAHWCRVTRGRIPELREQAVALRLADYGNKDGTNCHPGIARLADDTCASEKTIRRALSWLTENGWVTITHRGRRKLGEADVYRLTIPAPLAANEGWWTREQGAQWMERPSTEPKRPELRREKPSFPAVTSDRYNSVLEVRSELLEVTDDVLEVNDDLPPGPTHPGLSTPLRDSISASHASVRGDEADLIQAIENEVGGPLRPDVEAMVDGMLSRGADPRMVFRVAIARERNPA